MHHCCNTIRCQRQLTFLGNKSFSDKISLATFRKKYRSKKLNSVLGGMDSHTKLVKEPVNPLQEAEISNFISEAKTKFCENEETEKAVKDCKLYVPGSGAIGAAKSLYLKCSGSGYLFNCGEDVQKSTHIRLGKLKYVFISHLIWGNVGGLPGLFKKIYNIHDDVKVHGPPGMKQLHEVWRNLIYLRGQEIEFVDTTKDKSFDDGILQIKSVPLYSSDVISTADDAIFPGDKECDENETNLNIDTIIKNFLSYDYYGFPLDSHVKQRLKIDDIKYLMTDVYRKKKASICYIGKLRKGSDKLNLEACVDRHVPPSLLSKLKAREDVTLPNGNVVRFADVSIWGTPPAIFAVVDCPSEPYLDSLLQDPSFKKLQSATTAEDMPILIVHFSPPSVMNHPKYVEWMQSFPSVTKHLRVNEENICIGNVDSHELQTKLNLLHEGIFPKLPNPSIPVVSMSEYFVNPSKFDYRSINNSFYQYKIEKKIKEIECRRNWEPFANLGNKVLEGRSKMVIDLKNQAVGSEVLFVLCPEQYVYEALAEEGAVRALKDLKKELSETESTTEGDYPKVLFLGTGSGCPKTLRSTSGILIFTEEDACILLDCGEGTYNRLNVLFGTEKADEILLKLKAVYISHMHSDHHFGLIGILEGRRRAVNNLISKKKLKELPEYQNLSKTEIVSKLNIKPLYLLAPYRMLNWLSFYDFFYEKLKSDFTFISNSTFNINSDSRILGAANYTKQGQAKEATDPDTMAAFFRDVGLKEFRTCIVKHCFSSFGLTFKTNNDFKISYSGDCAPSGSFIKIASNSDLLIHEATYENDLSSLAETKKHSTIAQALFVAKRTHSKFTLLTHFSQRYRYIPLNTETFPDNVGISFDFMTISVKQLPLLAKFIPVMRLIFGDDLRTSTNNAIRKKLKSSLGKEELFLPTDETRVKGFT